MKSLRTIFMFVALAGFIGAGTLSVKSHIDGNKKASTEFAIFALASAFAPAVGKATLSLGFFQSAGMQALDRHFGQMGTNTQKQGANLRALDASLYVRRKITDLNGVYRLIESDNVKTKGITNIDKNRLAEGENFAIEAIALREGNHATKTDPKEIANYTNVASSVQAELRNAELVITQDSREILRLSVSSLLAPAANTISSNKDSAYSLRDNAVVLLETKPFEINLEFPAAVGTASASTSEFFAEVELYGKMTGKKFV